jgi:hypothetical protein
MAGKEAKEEIVPSVDIADLDKQIMARKRVVCQEP